MAFSTRMTLDELIRGRRAYLAVDLMGGAGGMALGAVLEGFRLVGKREGPDGVGLSVMLANKAVLGHKWNVQASDPERWRKVTADVTVSAITVDDERSVWAVLRYAAQVLPAVVVLDTVPDVFTAYGMAADLTKRTRLRYRPTEITYNDLSLGGALDRRRTFHVLSQVPFGVDRPALTWLPVAQDAVIDLLELRPIWVSQPLRRPPTWYSAALRTPEHMVDGYMQADGYRAPLEWEWSRPGQLPGEHGLFPIRGRDGRLMTHREIARLMGFPDSWRIGTVPRGPRGNAPEVDWGSSTSVHPARWIMGWAARSLNGNPGPMREPVIDISADWQPLAERQWGRNTL